jgi:(1->4)-alpha-D-glucan 1-alpha-D-glucosylmutase
MLGTSSHDSKRGEDARARIVALSGHAQAWQATVHLWLERLRQAGAPEIDRNDVYLLFQMLLGSWPIDGRLSPEFGDRLWGAFQKSLREARTHTEWTAIDKDYESAAQRFVEVMLADERFLDAFRAFERRIGEDGALTGLVQTTLKLTVPGVPDIYQGAELWEQSMVDPDNRRPVDFAQRQALLGRRDLLLDDWPTGAIKQHLISAILGLRRVHPDLFAEGDYQPLAAGEERLCAFLRRHDDKVLLVATKLWPWRHDEHRLRLDLPVDLRSAHWGDVIGGAALGPWGDDAERLMAASLPLVLFAELR